MWKVVTNSNLNPPLKLFFYSPILTNNNLLLKIYCENIVVAFLDQDFLFFILFLLCLISFHPYISFLFFLFFSSTHVVLSLSPPPPFIFFFSFIQEHSNSSHSLSFFSSSLSLSLYLIPKHSSPMQSRQVIFVPKQLAQPKAVTHLRPQHSPNGSDGFCLLSFFLFFFCYDLINFKIVFLSLYSDNLIMLEFRDV